MKVLFVCEGNVNRSQMAASILKNCMPDIEVSAAGTLVPAEREGKSISTISQKGVAAMQEISLDISSNIMHQLTSEMVKSADRVILVGPTPGGPLPTYLGNSPKLEIWDVPDPGYGHISHADAREMIREKVQQLTKDLHICSS